MQHAKREAKQFIMNSKGHFKVVIMSMSMCLYVCVCVCTQIMRYKPANTSLYICAPYNAAYD